MRDLYIIYTWFVFFYRCASPNALFLLRDSSVLNEIPTDKMSRFKDDNELSQLHLQVLIYHLFRINYINILLEKNVKDPIMLMLRMTLSLLYILEVVCIFYYQVKMFYTAMTVEIYLKNEKCTFILLQFATA